MPLSNSSIKPFLAPTVTPVDRPLGRRALLDAMGSNALRVYGKPAFQQLNLFGQVLDRRSLLTNDPEVIRAVLVDHADAFKRTDATLRILAPVLGDGLLLSEGANWRFQRRTMAPAFAPRAMEIVARVAAEVADDRVLALAKEGRAPIDLLAEMQTIALEVAGRAMFSMTMAQRGQRLRELFEAYGIEGARPFPLDLVLPTSIPSPADIRRNRLGRRWLAYIRALMEQREALPASDGAPRDLFDLLSQARDPESGRGFDRREMRDQLATMIIAGHETTALAMLWSLIMVAGQPALQRMLAEESLRCPARPTPQQLDALVLHRSVIQESMRLFPPVFLIVREAQKPLRIGRRVLFKGDLVSIAPWVLHRHEAHWQQPDHFDALRFMPERPTPTRFTYLPFGAGPRICIGMSFAMTEANAVLAAFMRRFEVSMVDDEPIVPRAVVTTYPDPIPRFRLRTRRRALALAA